MFGITNWQTTISGLPALIGAIVNIYTSIRSGSTPAANEWSIIGTALSAVLIGINAKDKNVTGGTVPQTSEASRRTGTPLPSSAVVAK